MAPKSTYGRSEIREMFQIQDDLIDALEQAELVRPTSRSRYGPAEVDRIRVAVALTRELEVQPDAVEIILRLRERIFAMERQMREILERLARELPER